MAEILKPDICVIGAGSGGLSVAAAAAAFGVPAVLIERHKMGGDCLNTGCVPSKALLAAAKRAEHMRNSSTFGVGASQVPTSILPGCTTMCTASSPRSRRSTRRNASPVSACA